MPREFDFTRGDEEYNQYDERRAPDPEGHPAALRGENGLNCPK
jgi:hypothetical protein